MVETKIIETKAGIIKAREKVAQLKDIIVSELSNLLPNYLDIEIAEFVGRSHETVGLMREEQLRQLKTTISRTIPIAVSQVTSRLNSSEDWFTCRERTQYGFTSAPLWDIVQSVDEPLLEVLTQAGFNVGKWRLSPQPWGSFTKQRSQLKVDRLNEEYRNALTEFCGMQERLRGLEDEKRREAASQRWRSLA